MHFNDDGTMTAAHKKDKALEKKLNKAARRIRRRIVPVVEFLKRHVLIDDDIMSQELVINAEQGILALCDLSSSKAVCEIKASNDDPETYAEQLHYQADGRKMYLLTIDWHFNERNKLSGVEFIITRVETREGVKPDKRKERKEEALNNISQLLIPFHIKVIDYQSSKEPVLLKCTECQNEWSESYRRIKDGRTRCPVCNPHLRRKKGRKQE